MATSAITNTIKDASGTAVSGVVVTARLRPGPGFRVSDSSEVAGQVATTSDGSGNWTLNLERVANITPTNSYWEIEEDIPEAQGGRKTYAITVGSVGASLYASLLNGLLPASTTPTALTLAAGDARYEPLNGLVFNVRAFGALGDGVTDDTAAIQTAIDIANTAGGALVYLRYGTYLVTGLVMKTGVRLVGDGPLATTLKLKASTTGDVLKGLNFGTLTGGGTAGGISQWSITDLSIDGNKANQAVGGYGLRVYGFDFTLERVYIRNCKNDGFYSEWGSAGTVNPDSMESSILRCKFHDNAGNGVTFKGPHDSQWINCIAYLNSFQGFNIGANGGSEFVNCHSWGASQDYAWQLSDTCALANCQGEGASAAQILVLANDCSIVGGRFYAAGASVPVGIVIGDGGHSIGGLHIITKVINCTSGAVNFANDAGVSRISLLAYQTSGAGIVGTASATTFVDVLVQGGGTGSRFAVQSGVTHKVVAQTLAALGGITFDAGAGDIHVVTLGAECNGAVINNGRTGQKLTVEWLQDGTGSRAYVWPANAKFAAATAPAAATVANRRDAVTFRFDGTNWFEISRSVNVG